MYYIPRHQIEILLPLFYNDGTPVEPEKIDVTINEIVEKFGGCRITSGRGVPAFNGYWLHDEMLYVDPMKAIIVEAPDINENFEYLSRLKQTLQQRFDQIEIYITVTVQDIKRIA